MNYSVIPKSITKFKTGRSKAKYIYVWAYINLCSDFQNRISHITEKKLSERTRIPERTIQRIIKRFKDANCLEVQTRTIQGFKKRNSYHFNNEEQNYFLIDNDFFHKGYEPKIAGFMLLIRSICLNNTDKVLWCKTKIAEEIGINRNTTSSLLEQCQTLGLIKSIPNGYEITEDCLTYTAVNNKIKSPIYQAICNFCKSKGVNPPIWDKYAMDVIHTKYNSVDLPSDHESNINFQLNERCKQLPKEITMQYFIKVFGMDEQYRAVIATKSEKVNNGYAFNI